jgi:hypothetical protein
MLGAFCGLFTFSGIVYVLMRLLPFKWKMGAIAFIICFNPLLSILMTYSLLSFDRMLYWLLCFGFLLLMLFAVWIGFCREDQPQGVGLEGQSFRSPHKASLTHPRRMLWVRYAMVFVISMILTFAISIIQKRLGDDQGFFYFLFRADDGRVVERSFDFLASFEAAGDLPQLLGCCLCWIHTDPTGGQAAGVAALGGAFVGLCRVGVCP